MKEERAHGEALATVEGEAGSDHGHAGVTFTVRAIGLVRTPFERGRPVPKHFKRFAHGTVEVFPEFAAALEGLSWHPHLWLIVYRPEDRGSVALERGAIGEGSIGLSLATLRGVEGRFLRVDGVDLDDRTPLLGIRPHHEACPAPRGVNTEMGPPKPAANREKTMVRIAIPMAAGQFSEHFGGAEAFLLSDVEESSGTVVSQRLVQAPPHERGAFPQWLRAQGVAVVLAGGMGPRAVQMLEQFSIRVVTGVAAAEPRALIKAFVLGGLQTTGETCSGGHLHGCGDHGRE